MEQKIRQSNILGRNLKKLRVKAGLTQEETVIKLVLMGHRITRSIYSQMEAGQYNVRISEIKALKEIFKASYEDLFDD
jgi:hypothetical protein